MSVTFKKVECQPNDDISALIKRMRTVCDLNYRTDPLSLIEAELRRVGIGRVNIPESQAAVALHARDVCVQAKLTRLYAKELRTWMHSNLNHSNLNHSK